MGLSFRLSILTVLCFLSSVLAQETPSSSSVPGLPTCATKCMTNAYNEGICAPQNQTCTCINEQFQNTVSLCVSQNCTVIEALATKNITMTMCHAPVRNRSQEHVILSITLMVIAGVCITTRFVSKIFVAKLELGWDDWTILMATIFGLTGVVTTVTGTIANGLGRDLWTLTPGQINKFGLYFFINAWMYYLEVALIKLSILFFYMRIFPSRPTRYALWGTIAVTAIWGFAYTIISIFLCKPVSYNWLAWDGTHSGKCVNVTAVVLSNAVIGIALDFWMLAIPLREIRQLKMHWKKKVGVGLMFGVGIFITIVSIIRLRYIVGFTLVSNFTWDHFDTSVWSSVEICIGVVVPCMPSIRLVLVRMFPVLGGTIASSQEYHKYGSGHGLSRSIRRRTTGDFISLGSIPTEQEDARKITYQKSYEVRYVDNEGRLAQTTDPPNNR